MQRPVLAVSMALAAAAASGCAARTQHPTPATAQDSARAQTAPTPGVSADTASASLAVRPGDVVKIVVWGHEDLSGDFPIDENYNLLLPLVGSINVRHMSVTQLRQRLDTELSQLFQRPFFTLTPLFRVAVLGEVYKPGLYSVDPTLTVVDLLALAGGPTRQANNKKLQLIRGGENIRISLEPAAIARSTLRELGVRSGDQLVVPRSSFTRDDFSILIQLLNFVLLAYTVIRH
jgi:protein involved in polysaccharide export with SLBB domain